MAPIDATPAPSRRTEFGVFTEFSQAPGMSEAVALEPAMAEVAAVEAYGYDAVWLAEIHFQKDRSVLAAPLAIAPGPGARNGVSWGSRCRCCRSAIRCTSPRTSPRSIT